MSLAVLPPEALGEILAVLLKQEPSAARTSAALLGRVSRRLRVFSSRFLGCRLPWLLVPARHPVTDCGCTFIDVVCQGCLQGADCGDCVDCRNRIVACGVCETTKLACCTSQAQAHIRCSGCAHEVCLDCTSKCDSDLCLSAHDAEACRCKDAVLCKNCWPSGTCLSCGISLCEMCAGDVLRVVQIQAQGAMPKLMDVCEECSEHVCWRCRSTDSTSVDSTICFDCSWSRAWEDRLHGEAQYQAFRSFT